MNNRIDWEEELQNLMEEYIVTAELGHLAKDVGVHKAELRRYWEELKKFVTTIAEEARREFKSEVERQMEIKITPPQPTDTNSYRQGWRDGLLNLRSALDITTPPSDKTPNV